MVFLFSVRAGIKSLLHRQLFEKPTLPENIDLKSKTAIVTGSNTGIGLECARQLLDLRLSRLILAVRNDAKGQQAREGLAKTHPSLPGDAIEVWKLDMEDYASVTAFAERAKALARLDIIVLNAGVAKTVYKRAAATGHEETIQVNMLSTALLALLLPVVKAKGAASSSSGRLVVMQSDTSSWAKFREKGHVPLLPALDDERKFDRADHYFTSKLILQLFMIELARRVPASVAAVVTMPNPGWTYGTGLGKGSVTMAEKIISFPNRILGSSPSAGARVVTTGAVAFGPEAHGQYIEDGKLQP
ncbi:NAD(P)-binding protein [Apiospora phragmitis]|uniref:NAD(P)-binding protein n=1 Tax=Apiospora phragmitis TaxID=2905665 RepID=A0ABR1VZS0_9PEZI